MFFQNTPLVWLFQSYWRDEAFSVILAQRPIVELLNITAKDFSPPLYYIMLKYWMMLWGTSEVATRLLSVFAFFLLLVTLIAYFRKVDKCSILEITIIGISIVMSPIITYYAFETRMYSWAALFATAPWLALFRKKHLLYVVLTIMGLYTQYFQVLIVISQLTYILISEQLKCRHISEAIRSVYKEWGMVYLKVAIVFVPWIIFVIISHSSSTSSFWIKKPTLDILTNTPAILATGYEEDFNIKFGLAGLSVAIYVLIIMSGIKRIGMPVKIRDHFATEHFAYILWLLIPASIVSTLSLFGPSLYLPRYLIVSSPALFFFIASELKKQRLIFSILLISIILFQMKNYQDLQIKYRKKENLRKIFTEINNQTKDGDVLYLESELDFHLAQYYFRSPNNVYIVGKPYSELPPYVGKSMIPESHVSVIRPSGETGLWLKSDRSTPSIN